MNAADVMVSNVITVGPDATVQEVAGILLKNKISAVPVVSQIGKILGIVSAGDMLRRVESHTLRHRSWWRTPNHPIPRCIRTRTCRDGVAAPCLAISRRETVISRLRQPRGAHEWPTNSGGN